MEVPVSSVLILEEFHQGRLELPARLGTSDESGCGANWVAKVVEMR